MPTDVTHDVLTAGMALRDIASWDRDQLVTYLTLAVGEGDVGPWVPQSTEELRTKVWGVAAKVMAFGGPVGCFEDVPSGLRPET